ncbi:MAG: M16 family metallopeptidase [Phycisphaerales bacterium JB043]
MNAHSRIGVILVALVASATLAWPARAQDPNALGQSLPIDPTIIQSTHHSGLRVVIKPIPTITGVSVHLRVPAGTLRESDAQRGSADLLHRMIASRFNQTRDALGFRASTGFSAWLSFDSCSYTFDIPDASRDELKRAIGFARDILATPPSDDSSLENARNAARTRTRSLDIPQLKAQLSILEALDLPVPYAERFPQIVEHDGDSPSLGVIGQFHNQWHSPDGAVLVIVGNVGDAARVGRLTESVLRPLQHRQTPLVTRADPPRVPSLRAVFVLEPGLENTEVEYIRVAPPQPPARSIASRRDATLAQLAQNVLRERIDRELAQHPDIALRATVHNVSLSDDYIIHNMLLSGPQDSVESMISVLGATLSPSPVTESELISSTASLKAEQSRAFDKSSARSIRRMATRLAQHAFRGDAIMSQDDTMRSLESAIASIRPQDVTEQIERSFGRTHGWLVISTTPDGENPTPERARTLFASAEPSDTSTLSGGCVGDEHLLCLDLPDPPSAVASIELDPDSSVFHATLTNGVVVHHLHDSSTPASVSVSFAITRPDNDTHHQLTLAALTAFRAPHTATHSRQQIETWLRQRNITIQGRVHSDAVTLTVSTPVEHLESVSRLTASMLAQPNIEPTTFSSWQHTERERLMAQRAHAYQAVEPMLQWVGLRLPGPVFESEPPIEIPFDREDVQTWLASMISQDQVHLAIRGDIESHDAIDIITRTLGRLKSPRPLIEPVSDRVFAAQAMALDPIIRTIELPESGTQGVSLYGYRIPSTVFESERSELMVLEQALAISIQSRFSADPRVSFPPVIYLDRSTTSSEIAFLLCLAPSSTESAPLLHNDIRAHIADLLQGPLEPDLVVASRERAAQQIRAHYQDPGALASDLVLNELRDLPTLSESEQLDRVARVSPETLMDLVTRVATPNALLDITLLSGDNNGE